MNIHVVNYNPLKGSSYIPLPAKLANKKAVINIQNTDQKCFMWSVLASLISSKKDPQRVIHCVQHVDQLDFTGIAFPVRICDVPKFEKRNCIFINVFGYEGRIYPLHLTKERRVRHIDLLLIQRGEGQHNCCIRNFNRLMGDQNDDNNQYFYCHYCLHGFTKRCLLKRHVLYCQLHGAQRTKMPADDDKWLSYTDVSKQQVPFVVYADFESILEIQYGCQPDPKKINYRNSRTRSVCLYLQSCRYYSRDHRKSRQISWARCYGTHGETVNTRSENGCKERSVQSTKRSSEAFLKGIKSSPLASVINGTWTLWTFLNFLRKTVDILSFSSSLTFSLNSCG